MDNNKTYEERMLLKRKAMEKIRKEIQANKLPRKERLIRAIQRVKEQYGPK